ncbi:hypothetical protein Esti_004014 [Eimeria stiedai]
MLLGVYTPGGSISSSFLRASALRPSPRRAAAAAAAEAAAGVEKAAGAAAAACRHSSYPRCQYLTSSSSSSGSSSRGSKLLCSSGVQLPQQQHVVLLRQQQQQQRQQQGVWQQQRPLFDLTSSVFQLGEQQQQLLQHKESRVSGHLKEEYWSVVRDVASYKHFIPWCTDSGVLPGNSSSGASTVSAGAGLSVEVPRGAPLDREGTPSGAPGEDEVFDGFLQLSLGLAADRFVSRVACTQRGDTWSIRCSAVDSAVFRTLETCWTFTDCVGAIGCHIEFHTSFSFRSSLYQQLARLFLREVAARMTCCFEARVGALYPKPHAAVAAAAARAAAAAGAAAASKPLQCRAAAERPEATRPCTAQQQQQQVLERVKETAEWRLSPQASQGVWRPRDVALLLWRLETLQNPGLAAATAAASGSSSSSSRREDRLTCGEARALRVLLCSRWGLQAVGAAFLAFDDLQQQQQRRALLTALRDLSHAADLTTTSVRRTPKKVPRLASLLRRLFPSSSSSSSSRRF